MLSADRRKVSSILTAILAMWFLLVLAAGYAGAFESGPSRPPLAVLLAVVGPLLIFAAAYRASRRVHDFVLAIDLGLLTAVQSWRVIGVMFLVFYAFDLEDPKVLNAKHSFQAWGQISGSSTSAVNLGIFYVDDPAQKRWMLRFDNPAVLDKISAVLVTIEPHGGTSRPTGQKLMYAYLGHEPNHP